MVAQGNDGSLGIAPLPRALVPWTGFVLGKVAEMSQAYFARALEPLGITPQHLGILMVLHDVGPQKQSRLSEPLQINRATMVRLINECEAAELVQRRAHPSDRRAHLLHLTAHGLDVMERAVAIGAKATSEVFGVLDADEQAALHAYLVRLAVHADRLHRRDHDPPPPKDTADDQAR